MLSVIIPALNSASTISHTLSSIFSNRSSKNLFEVLVIDNGSSDDTVQIAKKYPVKVHHCRRRGIGSARNYGIRMARGDIVCFTDSDCVVESDWLETISDFFEQNPDADGVGGPVLPYLFHQNKIQRLTGELFVEDQGYPNEIKKVEFGSFVGIIFGSNSAYKKEALIRTGLFFEPGGSNLELAWRLARMKRNLFFDPSIRACHIFPWNLGGIFEQQFRWGLQSTQMKRVNNLDEEKIKEIAVISYFVARRLLSLVSLKSWEKRMLHFAQLAAYSLGQIYGYGQ